MTNRWMPLLVSPILVLIGLLLIATETRQDEVITTTNQNVNVNNNQETIKYGNTKTNNYNVHSSNYQPTQVAQMILNFRKPHHKKLRKSRPPTIEESEIKQRLMNLYHDALISVDEPSASLIHLGRVLQALNPKYISTARVARAVYADPANPDVVVVPPEAELPPPDEQELDVQDTQPPLELSSNHDYSIGEQLDALKERFESNVHWDKAFAQTLAKLDDRELQPYQIAFKRLIQCLAFPSSCNGSPRSSAKRKRPFAADSRPPVAMLPAPNQQSKAGARPNYAPPVKVVAAPAEAEWLQQMPVNVYPDQESDDFGYEQDGLYVESPTQSRGYGSGYPMDAEPSYQLPVQHQYQQSHSETPESRWARRGLLPDGTPNEELTKKLVRRFSPSVQSRRAPTQLEPRRSTSRDRSASNYYP